MKLEEFINEADWIVKDGNRWKPSGVCECCGKSPTLMHSTGDTGLCMDCFRG